MCVFAIDTNTEGEAPLSLTPDLAELFQNNTEDKKLNGFSVLKLSEDFS